MQTNGKNGTQFEAAAVPLWREAFVGFDWLALHASPVYYGLDVPCGNGEPVIVVPGFLAADLDALELYGWLRRIGYRPYFSGVGRNAECPEVLTQRLFETVNRAYAETGLKVSIVGHSLGGTIARSAAVRMPGRIKQVIALASPRSNIRAHPTILAAAQLVRGQILRDSGQEVSPDCYTQDCTCAFATSLRELTPETPRVTSIYTRNDGIVDWRSCTEDEPGLNHEVDGTHLGLFVNPAVYRVVADLLAEGAA